ncbi:MAG: phage tail sheath protein [Acidaminococcus fermentans]|uniref:phage tail sheath C-terminal domain-containing protein n=1 Tax=Acidaminococcus fermentans TaxID=905 RepID=UPI002430C143|nr:phage tail sheath C-terminal domain-containing protein [Acidaminococcus fermentans]MCI7193826.1 phage tail sheath protein [Acidaminococcus fermentans]
MANEAEVFGLPQVIINFRTKATTAIKRSARGIVAMILHNESADEIKNYVIRDVSDIPDSGLTPENVDLIKKCLLGTPLRILVYTLPLTSVDGAKNTQANVLKILASIKWNWLCAPTATTQEQQDLASWIKAQRTNKRKTFKAVLSDQAADHEGIVNFCTNNIKVQTDTDSSGKAVYTTYTALQYTARIAGILAGLALDRSATYFKLTEVESVEVYEDIDTLIDKGELLLLDEQDGDGVKIARACNSLVTFTTDKGEDYRYIKIIEALDMMTDDIRDTFKKYYVGKYINDYDHKMLFIGAIKVYFEGIKGNVLDKNWDNTVDIDEEFQANYAKLHGDDPTQMTKMQIRQYNTGTKLALTGNVKPVNAMEDLTINFTF